MANNMRGHKVPPLSILKIRKEADNIRRLLQLGSGAVNMSNFLEFVLPRALPSFEYQVIDVKDMGQDEARTYPNNDQMLIRSDVYDELCNGDGRAQFTIAHEIGHLVLHGGITDKSFARNSTNHQTYEDSEWQADTFAAEFLMPYEESRQCSSGVKIKDKFGVSASAADIRYKRVN